MFYDDLDDIPLINDLATGSDASEDFMVSDGGYLMDDKSLETEVGIASPADWQVIHSDIQSLHWSILCIYVICMFCWICKQWG